MADENRARVGKVILLSAAALGVMALGAWVALPPTQSGRGLIVMVLAAAAAADALFALFLLTRS
jgi:uncharacterized membrane protein YhhN